MKKSLSRILSVALILAMMVSVVPFALAAELLTVTVSPASQTIEATGSVTLQASYTGVEGGTATYSWKVDGVAAGENSSSYTYNAKNTGSEAQNVTISCDVTVTAENGTAYFGTNSADITVNAPVAVTGITVLPETASVDAGETVQLYATVAPDNATEQGVIWSSGDNAIATVDQSGLVTGKKGGEVTITAKAKGNETITGSCKVTVNSAYALDASVENAKLAVGDKTKLTVVAKKDGEAYNDGTITVEVTSGKDYISLNEAKDEVTAEKAGTAEITVTLKDKEGNVLKTAAVSVEVVDIAINCPNKSGTVGSPVTLEPKLNNFEGDVTYKYSTKTAGVSLSTTTGPSVVVRSTVETAAKINVVATYKKDGVEKTAEKEVIVYFYNDHTAEFTIKSGTGSFSFTDTDVFTAIKFDNTAQSNLKQSVVDVVTPLEGAYEIKLTTRSSATATQIGTLKGDYETLATASNIKFTLNGKSGTQYIDYVLLSKEGLTVATGTIAFTTGGSYGDITYETDYNTPITFKEKDFQDFWNNATTTTGTLSKVVFSVSAVSPAVPSAGTLYTSSNKSTKVTSAMEFVPGYTGVKNTYDLDAVYYVPATTKTYYTVEIPFVAYGGTTASPNQTLSGIVVIELNNSSTDITSRGVVFGSTTNNLVSLMAADYKGSTGNELVSVIFKLPEVEDGRLYYDYDGILDSDRVTSKDEFFVEAADKQLSLKKVAFIPAAGTTGKITINYTGYGKDGVSPYEGKLTLNVVAKTKSDKFTDVTATSYSWAADSIDFLYYEEVVNGTSSTKFGPSSSITRGDFMIMLYRAFLEEDYGNYKVTSNFADVPKGTSAYEQETYQAIGVAKYLGIAKGDGTNFKPKSSITREEAMTLIYRTLDEVDLDLEYTSSKTTASFSDYSKVSTYAQTSITYLIRHGIVIGSNGMINPKSNITRAEMAVILHRVLTY